MRNSILVVAGLACGFGLSACELQRERVRTAEAVPTGAGDKAPAQVQEQRHVADASELPLSERPHLFGPISPRDPDLEPVASGPLDRQLFDRRIEPVRRDVAAAEALEPVAEAPRRGTWGAGTRLP